MNEFAVANIHGTVTPGRIHIVGSGRLLVPLQHNDWLRTNFALWPVAGVHFGYLVAALRVFRHLRHEFHAHNGAWVISGHSLGGAVAEVLGALVQRLTGRLVIVENYGGPAPWARLGRCVLRPAPTRWHACGNDPVPWLMFWNRHHGVYEHHRRVSQWPWVNHMSGYEEHY